MMLCDTCQTKLPVGVVNKCDGCHAASLVEDAERLAKSRVTDSACGHSFFVASGVEWRVRTGGKSLLWTRNGKRVSRAKVLDELRATM